jgi:hypothetical protein
MATEFSKCVVDHHPSVVKNVFPEEALIKIRTHYDILNRREIKNILGEKRNEQFEASLWKNIFPQGYFYKEFHKPVVSLYYYKNVENEKNRNALRSHGASHGVIDALLHPEYRHFWARITGLVTDILFPENPKENAKSIGNNQLIITSLLPVEELKATYLKDLPLADQERKEQLLKFKDLDLHKPKDQKFYWPYVAACKLYNLLREHLKFNPQEIENLIKTFNFKICLYEIIQPEFWHPKEDVYLSNLPYFIGILSNAEKIAGNSKNRGELIEEIMRKPPKIKSINLKSFLRIPKPENVTEKIFKRSRDMWKTLKFGCILAALQEEKIAEAAFYDISEYVISSTIVTSGDARQWTHEVLIPKPINYKEQIFKIVLKIRYLLLKINPAFNYEIDPRRGDIIRAYDEEIIFPRIDPAETNEIKETLENEGDYCKEIEKELEKYAKTSKLEQRMKNALNQTTTFSIL